MIIPIVKESEWTDILDTVPAWEPPAIPTIVISPHPDDETLGLGGLIKSLTSRAVDVSVIAVTDGENAYPGVEGLGSIREKEQRLALAELGVKEQHIHRLRFPDSGLSRIEERLVQAMSPYVTSGTHIIAPWTGDFHPDHEVCGRVARTLTASCGAVLTYYFFWTWHRGTVSTLADLHLVRFPLTDEQIALKSEALAHHASQLIRSSGDPILPSDLLEPMIRPYEVFLPS